MRSFIRSITLLVCLLGLATLSAQFTLDRKELSQLPVETMPAQDNDRLLRQELDRRSPGRAPVFAVSLPTGFRPSNSGEWRENGPTSTWYLRIESPAAKTLNLGFSEYNLPAGAELYISTWKDRLGPFTVADNEIHNQLWTPVMEGDELLLELNVPTAEKSKVQLYLTSVNHDFVGINKSLSGSCNLDVACGAKNGFDIVEDYRDQIRSVGRYTAMGINFCTGFLVNNTNEDGRPFFMTANHCNIREDNAPSLVVNWNFESPDCRAPGTPASSGRGIGNMNTTNSGAIFRARSRNSDMCLVELDDPVNAAAGAYFSGWSRSPLAPRDTVVAIHHPNGDEKRISFSFNQVYRSGEDLLDRDDNGRYLIVPSWSIGTTEPGSSGSPIFDTRGLVRGQLWRGLASCTQPDEHDQYGYFASSWGGDGTLSTSIRRWLDPCGLNPLELRGFDGRDQAFTLTATSNCVAVCEGADLEFDVFLGSGFASVTELATLENTTGATPRITIRRQGVTRIATVGLSGSDLTVGSFTLVLEASVGGRADDITFTVNVDSPFSPGPSIEVPADGSGSAPLLPTLSWSATPGATSYQVELSSEADFSEAVRWFGVEGSSIKVGAPLVAGRTYYWRVRSTNACSEAPWASASFAVGAVICREQSSVDTPVNISEAGTPTVVARLDVTEALTIATVEVSLRINHTFVGDLKASLRGPDGTTIDLFNRAGGCTGDNLNLSFSDFAESSASDYVATCRPGGNPAISGTFQPVDPLAVFRGGTTAGTWTLTVRDEAIDDGGAIVDFSLSFCGQDPDIVSSNPPTFGGSATLKIYPNPATEAITVDLAGDWPDAIRGELFDAAGRRVRGYAIDRPGRSEWRVAGLAQGIYFLRVASGSRLHTERVVIAR